MRSYCILTAAVLGIVLAGAVAVADIETTVITDADTMALNNYGGKLDWNYGGSQSVWVRRTGNRFRPYVHFDLSALDNTKLVTGAKLKMNLAYRNSNYGQTLRVFAIMPEAEDWDCPAPGGGTPANPEEGTATGAATPTVEDLVWNNAPKIGSTSTFADEGNDATAKVRNLGNVAVGVQKVGGSEMDMDLDVTDLIQWVLGQNVPYSDYSQSDDKLTFCMREISDIYAYYRSREYTSADDTDAPRLVITQVPEPVTMTLLAIGSLGLVAMRKRRK